MAIAAFTRAIERCEGYAPGWAGRAHARVVQGTDSYRPEASRELLGDAWEDAEVALQLDPASGEALASRAMLRVALEWDWEGARDDFARSVEYSPDLAEAHHWYALWFATHRDLDGALDSVLRAQNIDPLSPLVMASLGRIRYYRGEVPESLAAYRAALDREEQFVPAQLGLFLLYLTDDRPESAWDVLTDLADEPALLDAMQRFRNGDRPGAIDLLEGMYDRTPSRTDIALYAAILCALDGDAGDTLVWLNRAADQQAFYVGFVHVDPIFSIVREDPEYAALLEKVGLQ